MARPQRIVAFAGIDGASQASRMPDWYRDLTAATLPTGIAPNTFMSTVRDVLEKATTTDVAYRDPQDDEWVEIERHVALVNPAWLGEDNRERAPQDDAAWHIPTRQYDPVNPDEVYGPLTGAARQNDLSDEVFGTARLYRNGGEVHIDLFFPDLTVDVNDAVQTGKDTDLDPLVLGVTTGYDYFGSTQMYSRVIAANPNTNTVHRNLTDKRTRRHVKSADEDSGRTVDDVIEWWDEDFDRLDRVTDTLFETIVDASQYEVSFEDIPFTAADFFEALDVPRDHAETAEARLPSYDENTYTAWDLHEALSYAVEHNFGGKDDGRALRGYVRTANDILFRPPRAERQALRVLEDELKETDQDTLGASKAKLRKAMDERQKTAAGKLEQYASMRDRLKDLLDEADDAQDDDDAQDTDATANATTA